MKKFIKKTILYKPLRRIYLLFRNTFIPLGAIRNYIIFPCIAYFRKRKILPFFYGYEKIIEYKDKYKEKRCFIIATGPSLRMEDVEKLENEYTFAVNSFCKIFDKTTFRPTFYAFLDPNGQLNLEREGNFHPEQYAKEVSFLNDIFRKKRNYKKTVYLPICYQNHWYKLGEIDFDYSKNLKWTDDLLWGIYDKYTITNCMIDVAIYMGFTKIYLLGVDCNYSGPTSYFVDPGENYEKKSANLALASQQAMTAGYEFMAKHAKEHGIKIYNATRGGMLEVFERVNFDSIFENKT